MGQEDSQVPICNYRAEQRRSALLESPAHAYLVSLPNRELRTAIRELLRGGRLPKSVE
jgi:hypothetical protein